MTEIKRIIARAIKADIGRQFDAKPLPGPPNGSDDWSATGGSLDLGAVSQAAVKALHDAGYVVVPRKATEEMDLAGLDDPRADYCDRCMQTGHTRNSGWPGVIWKTMIEAFEKES